MSMSADIENKTNNNNRVVVVLGMHRAGTSALTRSLQVLGIGLGDNLYPATPENPKGYWEDQDCIAIDEEILGYLGAEFDRLCLDWTIVSTNAAIIRLHHKAVQFVLKRIAQNQGVWGVKDPRMCRLLGFWKKVFETSGCNVNYIISLRNPISIAKSLEKRNHLSPEQSYFLWLQHIVPTVLGSRKESRIVVDYDLLLGAPEEQIARIADHLKISFDKENNPLLEDFSRNFLDNNLRHSTYSLSQTSLDGHLPHDALKAYEILLRVAKDEISINSDEVQQGFEQIQSNLQVYTSMFTYANLLEEHELNSLLSFAQAYAPEIYPELEPRWASFLITLPESEVEGLGLYKKAKKSEAQISEDIAENKSADNKIPLVSTLIERGRENANLRQTVSELRQIKQKNENELSERNQQIANLNLTIKVLSHDIAERSRENVYLNLAIVERNQLISNQQAHLDSILNSRAWKLILKFKNIRNNIFGLIKGN